MEASRSCWMCRWPGASLSLSKEEGVFVSANSGSGCSISIITNRTREFANRSTVAFRQDFECNPSIDYARQGYNEPAAELSQMPTIWGERFCIQDLLPT